MHETTVLSKDLDIWKFVKLLGTQVVLKPQEIILAQKFTGCGGLSHYQLIAVASKAKCCRNIVSKLMFCCREKKLRWRMTQCSHEFQEIIVQGQR